MEIKSGQSYHMSHPQRSVQASRQSDQRDDQRELDVSRRDNIAQKKEPDRTATQPAAQGSEARFFAIESREETPVDPRLQVRAMRERIRQTYSEQENHEARREIQEQQAQDVQADRRAQRNEAREPIDLIA